MDTDKRLASLDTLRGFDMLFISGLGWLIVAVCSLFPGGVDCWLAGEMGHVEWNGWTHHDTIFPLFLFIAGISFPFSYAKQQAAGASRGRIYRKIVFRALALFGLGLLYNGILRLHLDSVRFYSVLARIGFAWMFAALLFINFKPRTRAVIAVAILIGYNLLCTIPAPDVPGADPLSKDGCLAGYIDRCLMSGHLCYGNFDPEGLLSLLPSIVTAMLGMFTGEWVRKQNVSGGRKTACMLAAAAVLFVLGYIWSIWFPINKKLWTSSFVLVVGGFSLASFALFYWIIDVKGHSKWAFPLRVVGMNSIAIYMLPSIIDVGYTKDFFFGGFIALCSPQWASVLSAATYLIVIWSMMYFLYKQKIFLKV